MKNLILVMLLAFALNASAQTIQFVDNDWNKAREEAKKQNKYLFVDAYTDWCYWCKMMDKKTFPDQAVADLLNGRFVALKLEMEHNYGVNVAMKYRVTGFPSFLVFSPDGKLLNRFAGYRDAAAFIDELKQTLKAGDAASYSGISTNVDLKFPEFYQKAYGVDGKKNLPEAATVNAYLDKQTDYLSEVNYSVMIRFASLLSEKHRNFLFENRAKYEQLYGKGEISNAVYSVANQLLNTAIKEKKIAGLDAANALVEKYEPEHSAETKAMFRLNYYRGVEDWLAMSKEVDAYIMKNGHEGSRLNDWSWTVYEKCNEPAVVNKAVEWMKPVIEKTPEYASMDTYAALLYKAGQLTEAKTYAERAIKLGQDVGENTEETEKLLQKIEGAK